MKIGIYGQHIDSQSIEYLQSFFSLLDRKEIEHATYAPFADKIQGLWSDFPASGRYLNTSELSALSVDYMITLGGDGTILSCVAFLENSDIPILGINLGRLGVLASTEMRFTEQAISVLQDKTYKVSERSLLEVKTDPDLFGPSSFALNDFTLHKRDTSSMVIIKASVDGEYLNTYWADGLIIATPTGSTGYSLSCGGPILFPRSGNLVMTPIAPHNLNVRPIVVPDSSEITLEIEGRSRQFLATLDSRSKTIGDQHEIRVKKSSGSAKLIQLPETTFSGTLRQKMGWGTDIRNF
jgi:NAD+ kinase